MAANDNATVVENADDFLAKQQASRRGCMLQLLGGWFGLMFLIIGFMVFIRSRVEQDPVKVQQRSDELVQAYLPENFAPHRRTAVFGNETIAFWDQSVLREDGRTTNLISLYRDSSWRGRGLAELETEIEETMEKSLARNEFHVRSKAVVPIENGRIFRFVGVAQVEERREEAASCFRVMMSPEGPIRLQSLGLLRDFDLAAQIEALQNFRVHPSLSDGAAAAGPLTPAATEPPVDQSNGVPPGAAQPDAAQPDAARPDAAQPDAARPDAAQPDAARPDAAQPDAAGGR